MGFDYALVHLKYTIPPAIVLTFLYRPFATRIDVYKVIFLISVAVVSTIPWDSYLIRRKIWTYPPSVIIGPTLFSIPAEEVFFFAIQTYNTTLLYLLLSKPILHSCYLLHRKIHESTPLRVTRNIGQAIIGACITSGAILIWRGGEGTYLGLILAWAGPFALLLWTFSYQFLVGLPYSSTVIPIAVPTLYLWVVDTIALRRGTWAIESGTKLGIHLWDGLEMEEAFFFLATNILIIFGQVAFDNALAILLTFPNLFPAMAILPSPVALVQALLIDASKYDESRLIGIRQAVLRLQKKSRSFYLASSVFSGRLRIDLVVLYSFCRVADDLVDNAPTESEAREWITKLTQYLDLAYESKETHIISDRLDVCYYIKYFPVESQSSLNLLPTNIISYGPLYQLLAGFKTDLEFPENASTKVPRRFPIQNEHDLDTYAARVAGTVAELCLELVFHHSASRLSQVRRAYLVRAGGRMGIALQYVNISRDIATDAKIGRVYIPISWLKDEGLGPQDILERPDGPVVNKLRSKLLDKAFAEYEAAKDAIEQLPADARAPMRVAIESYMEIGRVLREKGYRVKEGKATVPKLRRLKVAWEALNSR